MDPNNDDDPSNGIDGWRLDVAREVPFGFWKDWRKLVKSINPNAIEVQKLIAVFQMTYCGAPMIYCGDEVGMWGADDPHGRKLMVWDDLKYDNEIINNESGFIKGFGTYTIEQNKDVLEFYRKLTHLRKLNLALQMSTVKFLYSNDEKKSFVFERKLNDNWFVVAINLGDVSDDISLYYNEQKIMYEEKFSDERGSFISKEKALLNFDFNLPGRSVRIYQLYSNMD